MLKYFIKIINYILFLSLFWIKNQSKNSLNSITVLIKKQVFNGINLTLYKSFDN